MRKYLSSDFVKSTATLSAGTLVAQVIPVLIQIYLRRIFDADAFGTFAVFLTMVSILVVIASLRYELSVVLCENDTDSANIVCLSVFFAFITNLVFFIVIWCMGPLLAALFNVKEAFSSWLYFIPISAFFLASFQAVNYYLIKQKAYRASALNKVWRRVTEGIIHLFSGLARFPIGLIYGDIAGNLANVVSGSFQVMKRNFKISSIRISRMRELMVRYKEFPLYQAIPSLLNTFSSLAPVLYISYIYSTDDAGYFDLTRIVLILPLTLIGTAISQVLMQKASERIHQKLPVRKQIYSLIGTIFLIYFPMVIIVLFFGEDLFSFFFGKLYATSGYYAKIIVFAFTFQFMVSPVSIVLTVLEKLKTIAVWQLFYFLMIASLLLFRERPMDEFLMIYVCVDIVSYVVYFFLIRHHLVKYEKSIV